MAESLWTTTSKPSIQSFFCMSKFLKIIFPFLCFQKLGYSLQRSSRESGDKRIAILDCSEIRRTKHTLISFLLITMIHPKNQNLMKFTDQFSKLERWWKRLFQSHKINSHYLQSYFSAKLFLCQGFCVILFFVQKQSFAKEGRAGTWKIFPKTFFHFTIREG